jgi:hypothetical protein
MQLNRRTTGASAKSDLNNLVMDYLLEVLDPADHLTEIALFGVD